MMPSDVAFDRQTGLAPAIVQDSETGRVLMLGYVNEESLRLTRETGYVHFWSRSRKELWRKGATSGNTFLLQDMSIDCDADAVLLRVRPSGPACHRGTTSCFDPIDAPSAPAAPPVPDFTRLAPLWEVVSERARDLPEGSYTAKLIRGGVDAPARKVVEEATGVLLAARDHAAGGAADRVYEEAADLVYHLFVLLAERGLEPGGVLDVLADRAES